MLGPEGGLGDKCASDPVVAAAAVREESAASPLECLPGAPHIPRTGPGSPAYTKPAQGEQGTSEKG